MDSYRYSAGVILSISECYKDIYDGIGVSVKRGGVYYEILNPFDIAEFKADYEWGCKFIKRIPGKNHLSVHEAVIVADYLNGSISKQITRRR